MFDQTADLLELRGENPFRVRAYRRAARTVEGLPQSVRTLLGGGYDLAELPGIGKDLAGKIADIVTTGHFQLLDSLKTKVPGQIGDMAALPGLKTRMFPSWATRPARLIGEREPCDIDMERIVAAAREHGCHLELNAEPDRLDINDMQAHAAREAGVRVAISTDAHSVDALKCMRFSVDQARRGGLSRADIINNPTDRRAASVAEGASMNSRSRPP